jgi:hypothetical protein
MPCQKKNSLTCAIYIHTHKRCTHHPQAKDTFILARQRAANNNSNNNSNNNNNIITARKRTLELCAPGRPEQPPDDAHIPAGLT